MMDTFFILILTCGLLIGLGMGMIRSLFPFLSIIIAIFLAGQSYTGWTKDLSPYFKAVVFLLIFGVIFIVTNVIGLRLYAFLTDRLRLGWIDRIGGGVLGIAAGLTFIGLIVILMTKFPFGVNPEVFNQSKIVPYSTSMIKLLLKILPEEFSIDTF